MRWGDLWWTGPMWGRSTQHFCRALASDNYKQCLPCLQVHVYTCTYYEPVVIIIFYLCVKSPMCQIYIRLHISWWGCPLSPFSANIWRCCFLPGLTPVNGLAWLMGANSDTVLDSINLYDIINGSEQALVKLPLGLKNHWEMLARYSNHIMVLCRCHFEGVWRHHPLRTENCANYSFKADCLNYQALWRE